ncbi:hypothetical protein VTK56DRAFT_6942 [Thermocarpiscus australiensis]
MYQLLTTSSTLARSDTPFRVLQRFLAISSIFSHFHGLTQPHYQPQPSLPPILPSWPTRVSNSNCPPFPSLGAKSTIGQRRAIVKTHSRWFAWTSTSTAPPQNLLTTPPRPNTIGTAKRSEGSQQCYRSILAKISEECWHNLCQESMQLKFEDLEAFAPSVRGSTSWGADLKPSVSSIPTKIKQPMVLGALKGYESRLGQYSKILNYKANEEQSYAMTLVLRRSITLPKKLPTILTTALRFLTALATRELFAMIPTVTENPIPQALRPSPSWRDWSLPVAHPELKDQYYDRREATTTKNNNTDN